MPKEKKQGGGVPTTRLLARRGAARLLDKVASHLVAVGITVLMISAGVRYVADVDKVEEATVTIADSAGEGEVGRGYASLKHQATELKRAGARLLPDEWRETARPFSLGLGVGALLFGTVVSLARAPSRAHAVRDLGWALAAPGAVAAIVLVVLEWRAIRAIKSALAGERDSETLAMGALRALREGGTALAPALATGALLIAASFALRGVGKRAKPAPASALAARSVCARFLLVLGLVPVVHFAAVVAFGALTGGRAVAPGVEPFEAPAAYAMCAAVFAAGVALWWGGKIDAATAEAGAKP